MGGWLLLGKSELDDILLTKDELNELKSFKSQVPHSLCLFPVLMGFGLVEEVFYTANVGETPVLSSSYSITPKGSRYLDYRKWLPWKRFVKYLADNWIGLVTLILTIITFLTVLTSSPRMAMSF